MTVPLPEDTDAYQRSLALLHRCLSPAGFLASPNDVDNYARVWARDGVIAGLAALASGESDLVAGLERTLSPSGYASYFDGLAHALALLTFLGDNAQQAQAEQYIQLLEAQIGSALLPAFWPVIQPGDLGWRELQSNHLYGQMKNMPYRYHNGGLWPVLTGLEVMGLVRHGAWERARHVLTAINAANAKGSENSRWEFAEYHHGQTHLPMGTKHLAWSAAAGVLAHQAVWRGISSWPLLSRPSS